MRVFVSATKEDLDPDCRPAVRRAIAIGDAQAETMEEWNAEYLQKPVDLCRQELEINSTHFVGIFAHRLGWVPPGFTISITEAEFEWAWHAQPRKQMAIYIPKPGTAFDKELERRADLKQTPEEKAVQTTFRRRVQQQNGTVVTFEDDVDLGILVSNRITLWSAGGLRPLARRGGGAGIKPPPVHLLGRSRHEGAFKSAWELLADQGLPSIAAFLIHGAPVSGQVELVERFIEESEGEAGDFRMVDVPISASWQRQDLATLLRVLGHELQPGWIPQAPAEIAARLATVLTSSEVALRIHNVHRYPRGAAGLIEEFWTPLRSAFATAPRRRCTLFLTMDGQPGAACQPLLFNPLTGDPAEFTAGQAFELPALGNFTLGELKVWLRKVPVTPPDPDATAQRLFDETAGDPARLFSKLNTESLTS